jgi:hypothetical protein
MSKALIAGIVVVLVLGGLVYYAMSGQTATSCEVCIEFNGQTKCRTAKGPNKLEAIKTASDNACAYIASGMTDSIACSHRDPKSTKCE